MKEDNQMRKKRVTTTHDNNFNWKKNIYLFSFHIEIIFVLLKRCLYFERRRGWWLRWSWKIMKTTKETNLLNKFRFVFYVILKLIFFDVAKKFVLKRSLYLRYTYSVHSRALSKREKKKIAKKNWNDKFWK